ncbi:MAG: hypothetical protein BWY82_02276 [Verrucomicrobia bacterium ADurb.Bin474]|nr:MAG: hypothetical protein BWY82_02276 [Verrucomicrobia bacterium ADurb.Bin474]
MPLRMTSSPSSAGSDFNIGRVTGFVKHCFHLTSTAYHNGFSGVERKSE